MSGGILVALGLLHIVSAGFREKMRSTIRRVVGSPAEAPAAAGGDEARFWGHYELVRAIGSGGMGVVYEARDRSLDRRVAIKKMRDEIRLDPAERQRFVQEAKTVAALHHPNIVDIFAIIEDEQDVYLVFEYIAGKTLAELLRDRGPLEFEGARRILRGACEAVEYAHRNKVIHRDIKTSNIMVSDEGQVKVMDFGVARQAKEAMTKMALTNTIVGTPPYMAPEQEQGTVRRESDIFSLAVCLYEMLTGELPFAGQGAGMLLNKINGRHVPLSSRLGEGLPPGLDQVIARALNPDPEKRYRTPAEFLSALDALSVAAR
jgi:serine/threonine-protein kinase